MKKSSPTSWGCRFDSVFSSHFYSLHPVSYTHLDVYKRQLEIHAPERILIHGDQPKALIFAKKLRDAVESEGIKVMYSGDAH